MANNQQGPRIIPLEEGWNDEIKKKASLAAAPVHMTRCSGQCTHPEIMYGLSYAMSLFYFFTGH
jgi:hypothetical protein